MDNPFTLTYDALWDMLLKHPGFVEDVKVGNRIRYNTTSRDDPRKREVQVADLPEVVLASDGLTANMLSTSSSSSCTRQYSWILATGDFRINAILHQVEWYVFVAMHNWRTVLTSLQWEGEPFVKNCRLSGVTSGYSDPAANRGIVGWSAVWRCEVDMVFKTSALLNELE